MNTSRSPLVWRGILAVVIGVVAVVWPGITVGAFVILFAFYAFMAAVMEAIAAFRTRSPDTSSPGFSSPASTSSPVPSP